MCHEIYFAAFLNIKRSLPNMHFIICGDLVHGDGKIQTPGQLPPFGEQVKYDVKDSVPMHELCKGTRLQMYQK